MLNIGYLCHFLKKYELIESGITDLCLPTSHTGLFIIVVKKPCAFERMNLKFAYATILVRVNL